MWTQEHNFLKAVSVLRWFSLLQFLQQNSMKHGRKKAMEGVYASRCCHNQVQLINSFMIRADQCYICLGIHGLEEKKDVSGLAYTQLLVPQWNGFSWTGKALLLLSSELFSFFLRDSFAYLTDWKRFCVTSFLSGRLLLSLNLTEDENTWYSSEKICSDTLQLIENQKIQIT